MTAAHVREALDAKIERHNLLETKIREMIEQNLVFIDTTGARAGQVNGLSVLEIGGYAFGKPVRITASVALGKIGMINIEREANLSGRFHDKGMQIIAGYLRRKFAQDKPLSLAASICFEQSYSGVDGDSASSTEIYALLSALSDLPIRQEIAVTGSVSQQGDMQPIGGVNQKIEGFYDVCRVKGLTGNQGVMIPAGKRRGLDAARRSDRGRREKTISHLSGCDDRARDRNSHRSDRREAERHPENSPRIACSQRWMRGCIRWLLRSRNSSNSPRSIATAPNSHAAHFEKTVPEKLEPAAHFERHFACLAVVRDDELVFVAHLTEGIEEFFEGQIRGGILINANDHVARLNLFVRRCRSGRDLRDLKSFQSRTQGDH